jgi:hypothetical protein
MGVRLDPNRALKTLPNSIQKIGMSAGLAEEPSNRIRD